MLRILNVIAFVLLVMPLFANAVDNSPAVDNKPAAQMLAPHKRISESTALLLNVITEAQGYFDKEPERFYTEVEGVLAPLIDFPSFTRSVMGPFGSRNYYKSLSKAQKQQYKSDYKRFVTVFRQGLITTYAKGLLAFSGQKIVVLPATAADEALVKAGGSLAVHQEIQGADKAYKVDYKMRPNKKGIWLVRNVTIEGINVGQLYRNQFIAAMAKNNNDFAKVVDGWVVKDQSVIK